MNFVTCCSLILATSLYFPLPAATPPKQPKQPEGTVWKEFEKERAQHAEFLTGQFHRKAGTATTSTAPDSLDDEEVAQKDVKTAAATTASTITAQPQKPIHKIPSLFILAAAQQLYGLWTTSTDDFNTTLTASYKILKRLEEMKAKDIKTPAVATVTTSTQPQQPTTDSVDMRSEITHALQSLLEKEHPDVFFMIPAVLTRTSIAGYMSWSWNQQLTVYAHIDIDIERKIHVIDTATKQRLQIIPPKQYYKDITCMSLNPQGTFIAYGTQNNDIRIIEVTFITTTSPEFTILNNSAAEELVWILNNSAAEELVWNPQGDHLAARMADNSVILCNMQTKELLSYTPDSNVNSLTWNHQGTLLAIRTDHHSSIVNTQAQQVFSIPTYNDRITSLSWNPQGTVIAYSTFNGYLNFYDLRTKKSTPVVQQPLSAYCLSWNPVANLLVWYARGFITIFDQKTKKTILSLKPNTPIQGLSWNPQGTLVISNPYRKGNPEIFNYVIQYHSYIPVSQTTHDYSKIVLMNPQGTRLAVLTDRSSDLYTIPEYTLDQLFFILGVNRLLAIRKTETSFYDLYRLQLIISPIINTFKESYTGQSEDIRDLLKFLFPD